MNCRKMIVPCLIVVMMALTACGNVDITKTSKGFYNPTNPNDVQIFMTKPDRPFEELGSITATGFQQGDTAVMHNALRAKAAPLGANAVIITSSGMQGAYQYAMGVAVRWKGKSK